MSDERLRCRRCAMSFRVQEKPAQCTMSRCPERGCGRSFWHGAADHALNRVIVGVEPVREVAW